MAAAAEGYRLVRDGFVAVDRGRAVGCVAVDLAGSIPLVIVAPAHQRRGIGTDLLSAALARLSASGISVAHAGSGGTDYIWPGVPQPAASTRIYSHPALRTIPPARPDPALLQDQPAARRCPGASPRAAMRTGPVTGR